MLKDKSTTYQAEYQKMNGQNEPLMNPYEMSQEQIIKDLHSIPVSQDIRQSYNPYGDDFAADLNPLIQKESSKHLRSLFATFILFVGEGVVIGLSLGDVIEMQVGELIGACVGIYFLYLIIALCCNPLFAYFNNVEHGNNFETSYISTKSISGHFSFHAVCYHYETRFHTRTVRDSNGNTHTETYTTQEKVVTHTATEQLNPKECIDDSGNIEQVRALTDIIFVHNKVNYRFKDEYSRANFQSFWYSFQERHRRDVHQDYSQNYVLPGLKPRITFYIGAEPKSYNCYLVVWSLVGMSWPFSMWVEAKISRFDIEYMKILTI